MTDSVSVPAPGRLSSVISHDKRNAFKRASRHSIRVRWLRRLILFGTIGLCIGIVVVAFFNPFRVVVPDSLSVDGAGLNGSRVTMERPKMSGYRSDGRPYDFIAKTAVQDLRSPNVLELNELDAHITMPDKGVAHITAQTGIYDSSRESMDLKGDVHITSNTGYDVRMSVAHVEFKAGNVVSKEPVSVVMQTGSVTSDAMTMIDNGKEISFEGRVHSVMMPASDAAETASQIKGTVP
jgi:lipopolysaccharide export system protein LptC